MVFVPRLKKKVKINSVSYLDKKFNFKAKVDPDFVEDFAVYVKTVKPTLSRMLWFPYGHLLKPLTKENFIDREYRVKGAVNGNKLELEVERLYPYAARVKIDDFVGFEVLRYTKEYKLAKMDDPYIEKVVKRYLNEVSSYTSAKIKQKYVDKAIKSWKKDLKLKPLAAEVLRNHVLENSRECHTKECTLLILPHLGALLFKGGQMMCTGSTGTQLYRRRISPLLEVPPVNIVNNLFALAGEKLDKVPQETVLENPLHSIILLPPIVGSFARKHETRHCFQYAAFNELLNPGSGLYAKLKHDEAKERAYSNLDQLVKSYFPTSDKMPEYYDDTDRKIVGEFLKGNTLASLINEIRDQDLLNKKYERGLISGILFSKAYETGQKFYEATASSLNGNFMLLAAPWLINIGFGLGVMSYLWPFCLGLNLLMAKFGYGNLPRYFQAKHYLADKENAESQLMAIATYKNLLA